MPEWLYQVLYWLGGAVCHQLPERSLTAGGRVMALCARCTGIYTSLFICAAILLVFSLFPRQKNTGDMTGGTIILTGKQPLALAVTAVLLMLPMEMDGVGNLLGLWDSGTLVRIITGSALGMGLPVFYMLACGYDLHNGQFTLPEGVLHALLIGCAVSLAAAYSLYMGWLPLGAWVNIAVIAGLLTALTGLFYLLLHRLIHGITLSFGAAWGVVICLRTARHLFFQ